MWPTIRYSMRSDGLSTRRKSAGGDQWPHGPGNRHVFRFGRRGQRRSACSPAGPAGPRYVAKANRVAPETISSEMLFRDVHKQMNCYTELVTTPVPDRVLELPPEAIVVRRRLTELLRGVWSDQWEKSPPKKNYKPTACHSCTSMRKARRAIFMRRFPDGPRAVVNGGHSAQRVAYRA